MNTLFLAAVALIIASTTALLLISLWWGAEEWRQDLKWQRMIKDEMEGE